MPDCHQGTKVAVDSLSAETFFEGIEMVLQTINLLALFIATWFIPNLLTCHRYLMLSKVVEEVHPS